MTRETIDRVIDWFARTEIPTIDLTGGAPEMNPDFRYFIEQVKARRPSCHVIDRCNLTILLDSGYEGLAQFLARHRVEIIASMPCYTVENVNAQRGEGVFDASIKAMRVLNSLGYGSDLSLHLVYNPVGAFLPGPQAELEADYKRELKKNFGIVFNNLYTITNLPIARFASYLRRNNKLEEYMQLLVDSFNPTTVSGLMCRNTISVSWTGEVFDCDFNQMLKMNWRKRDRAASSLGPRSGGGRESRNSHRQPLLRLHRRRRLQLRRGAPINLLGAQAEKGCVRSGRPQRRIVEQHSLNPGVAAQPFFR